jgi:hypothetical protein
MRGIEGVAIISARVLSNYFMSKEYKKTAERSGVSIKLVFLLNLNQV